MIPFRTTVVHRSPGRLRIKIPTLGKSDGAPTGPDFLPDFGAYLAGSEGISDISYDHRSESALISYDPALIEEDMILRAIKRLTRAAAKAAARILLMSPDRRVLMGERLIAYLRENPVDIRSDAPIEIPREIWR